MLEREFHHLMVAVTGTPKVGSTQHQIFSRVKIRRLFELVTDGVIHTNSEN